MSRLSFIRTCFVETKTTEKNEKMCDNAKKQKKVIHPRQRQLDMACFLRCSSAAGKTLRPAGRKTRGRVPAASAVLGDCTSL